MDINFEYYKIFYYAAKYKNITKAAAAMGSSQPNVTRVIRLLESALQCRLFVREARGIALTEEGERLYAHVEIAVAQIQSAQEELMAAEPGSAGTVEIGATETALHLFLLDALQGFKESHPKARIKIHNHTTPEILKKLAYGSLDFAVLTTPFQVQNTFTVTKLAVFREMLADGSRYQELALHRWNLPELEPFPWVGLGNGTATYELYKDYFSRHHADIRLDVEAATSDLLIPLIRSHFGIGFVPRELALPFLEEKELVQIPLTCSLPERRICMVCDRGREKSTVSVNLQKYLKEVRHACE